VIRRATVDDARAIAEVSVASWLGAYRGLMPDDALDGADVDQREERNRIFLAGGADALVAEDDEGVYGFASFGRSRDPDAGDEVGELYAIYLRPERWGRGLGRELHDAAVEALRAAGFAEATLWVLDSNERARRFYERAGWQADGSVRSDRVGELRALVEEVRYRIALTRST
jgi:GNAT superfamily N-acetyltransferase